MDLNEAVRLFNLEDYIRDHFDPVVESSSREELRIDCFSPRGCANTDTKQHLWVNVQKRAWICYKCGYGDHKQQPGTGRLVQFLADAEGVSAGVVIQRLLNEVRPTPAEELEKLLQDQFEEEGPTPGPRPIVFPKSFEPCPKLRYLAERGFRPEWLRQYGVRYCRSRSEALWYQRAIFPIYSLDKKLLSAVGRAVISRDPRWQNWPGSDIQSLLWPLWSRGSLGSLIPFAGQGQQVVLVEGVFDALGVSLAGYQALATLGKKLSLQQMEVLQRIGPREVILAWDFDAKAKMVQAVDRLRGRFSTTVFPFLGGAWRSGLDLGDMMHDPSLLNQFHIEMDNRIDIDSSEYLTWVLEVT